MFLKNSLSSDGGVGAGVGVGLCAREILPVRTKAARIIRNLKT
jgi:hypothetical protein